MSGGMGMVQPELVGLETLGRQANRFGGMKQISIQGGTEVCETELKTLERLPSFVLVSLVRELIEALCSFARLGGGEVTDHAFQRVRYASQAIDVIVVYHTTRFI